MFPYANFMSSLKTWATACLALTLASAANAACPAPSLPAEIELTEKVFSLTTSFSVAGQGQELGKVTAKFFSIADTFTYEDSQGTKLSEARARLLSWGTHIDVVDCEGVKIGEIKENVLNSFFKVYTVYSILDASGNLLAQSEKVDWMGTEFSLYDENRTLLAKISRPWLNFFSDKWTIETYSSVIDPRLIVTIGAFKTHIDNRRERSSDN